MKQQSLLTTETDLQKTFYRYTWQRYELVAPNLYLNGNSNEMDIFAARKSGYVDEIEIKLTLADFKADFKKIASKYVPGPPYQRFEEFKHDLLKKGELDCNYFSFLMPKDLADKCEIPEYAGLYVYYIDRLKRPCISEVKRAPLMHKRKITTEQKYKVVRKMAYRYWDMIK